jgi:hypothetical protein
MPSKAAVEEKDDPQITGSSDVWDAQADMQHITGKLTDPKQYRSKAEILAEKKAKDKAEKQKIREELLAPEPISDQDTKIFSESLAQKSSNSKSEL